MTAGNSGARPTHMLFDLDGVLIDSGLDLANSVNHTLESYGHARLPVQEIIDYVGDGMVNLLKRSFGLSAGEALPEEVKRDYQARYLAHCTDETVLYPGVREGLTRMHAEGVKLAVVTNKPDDMTREILSRLGVLTLFASIVAPERVTRMKPDPESLLLAMREIGASPEGTLMTGDTFTDIRAGHAAGLRACAVSYGLGDAEALLAEKPEFVFHSFDELMGTLFGP